MTKTVVCLMAASAASIVAGVWWIFPPAGLITLGVLLAVAGVLNIEFGGRR